MFGSENVPLTILEHVSIQAQVHRNCWADLVAFQDYSMSHCSLKRAVSILLPPGDRDCLWPFLSTGCFQCVLSDSPISVEV